MFGLLTFTFAFLWSFCRLIINCEYKEGAGTKVQERIGEANEERESVCEVALMPSLLAAIIKDVWPEQCPKSKGREGISRFTVYQNILRKPCYTNITVQSLNDVKEHITIPNGWQVMPDSNHLCIVNTASNEVNGHRITKEIVVEENLKYHLNPFEKFANTNFSLRYLC